MKRLAVITSGGDSSGMNAAIRGFTRTALFEGIEVYGFYHGYKGLMNDEKVVMDSGFVGGIITAGGTVLRTARCEEFRSPEGRKDAVKILRKNEIDGLAIIGGDGSLSGALALYEEHEFPVIGSPASIDNDIYGTEFSIGFDTAVNTALEAIDKIRDTAYSHDRVFVVEVMGRLNGFIALDVALAAGAEAVILPEVHHSLPDICENLKLMREKGKRSSIIVVAEGAAHANDVRNFIAEYTGFETRYLVLGHMQRGGSPTAFDRVLALRFGSEAAYHLMQGHAGEMVGIEAEKVKCLPLSRALGIERTIDMDKLKLVQTMSV